jgi:hypothetical protein
MHTFSLEQTSELVRSALRIPLKYVFQRAIIAGIFLSMGTAAEIGALGVSMVALTASPAKASCVIAGQIRDDISDADCPEAQHTGCIRDQLSPAQYMDCLAAQPTCLLSGTRRSDLPGDDCFEAQRTGCIRRALSPTQYHDCLVKQSVCLIGTQLRPDLTGLDCIEAQRTGCVRRMLTPTQYVNCLGAQPQ